MPINASNDFISELDRAIEGGSPARRCHMLRQIASLFLAGADRLDAHQIGFFDDVLLRLMEHVETSTLSHLSAMLAALAAAPKEAVRRLAHNEDAMVAGPVLVRSEALSDSDLIEIAGNRGQAHLLAISGRTCLSEALTDAILRRNDAASCRVLAKNEGAHFSDRGYSALVARAERDDDIADSLMLRPHLPASIGGELLARATPAVRARLLKIAPPEMRGTVQATLERIAVEASTKRPAPTDYTAAKSAVLALSKAGKLNDSSVNRFAVREERANLVAALSLLSDATIETIEAVVDPCGLIVACRASRLNWTTTLAVIRYRCGVHAIPPADIERRREAFEALPLSVAQRAIRFGSVRDLAMDSNSKGKALLAAGAT